MGVLLSLVSLALQFWVVPPCLQWSRQIVTEGVRNLVLTRNDQNLWIESYDRPSGTFHNLVFGPLAVGLAWRAVAR